MSVEKVKEYLDQANIQYQVIEHKRAYTAQEIAANANIPGQQFAKTVMIRVDGKMAMAVIPAPQRVNFESLKKQLGAKEIRLATEHEFKDLFPDCEVGAMPPFGHLYDMPVYVADDLEKEIVIAFCGGSHSELVQLNYHDFAKLVKPRVLNFTWQT